MTFSSHSLAQKLVAATRRRNQRLSIASADISADGQGRRRPGDVRLDVGLVDRPLRF